MQRYSHPVVMQVCLHYARSLFGERPRWPLHDFLERWRSVVPEVHPPASCAPGP